MLGRLPAIVLLRLLVPLPAGLHQHPWRLRSVAGVVAAALGLGVGIALLAALIRRRAAAGPAHPRPTEDDLFGRPAAGYQKDPASPAHDESPPGEDDDGECPECDAELLFGTRNPWPPASRERPR